MNNNKLIDKNNEILLNNEENIYLKSKIFHNKNEIKINNVRSYLNKTKYNYDIDNLKNKIKNLNLNIEVSNTVEAIKKINNINLFELLNLNCNKKKREKLDIPLYVEHTLRNVKKINTSSINNISSKKEIRIQSNNNPNVYEIFKEIESSYCVFYSKSKKKWSIFIYFNINEKEEYRKYDFIEVYSMLANKTLQESLIELIELLNIKIKNLKDYLDIYYTNLKMLNLENLSKYKCFYKIAKKQLYLLEKIIKYAIKECYFKTNINEIEFIYLSNRYLAEEVGKKYNTITPYINTFALMEFYKKNKIQSFQEYNDITTYSIYKIDEKLLRNADLVAKKMIENKISISSMNYKYIKDTYGNDVANSIILDKNIKFKGDGVCA